MWLCPLPSRRLKPTLQLASHSHCSSLSLLPPRHTNKQTSGMYGARGRKEVRGREWGGAEWWDEPASSLSEPGAPTHPGDSERMRDLCCDCHWWCMGWSLFLLLKVRSGLCLWSSTPWHSSPQSCSRKLHFSNITVGEKLGGGRRVKKIKKNQPFSSVAITITTSTSVTAAQVRRFCCFLAPPFGGCKLCSTPVRPQTF